MNGAAVQYLSSQSPGPLAGFREAGLALPPGTHEAVVERRSPGPEDVEAALEALGRQCGAERVFLGKDYLCLNFVEVADTVIYHTCRTLYLGMSFVVTWRSGANAFIQGRLLTQDVFLRLKVVQLAVLHGALASAPPESPAA